jgi:hypothetical protein
MKEKAEGYKKIIGSMLQTYNNLLAKCTTLNKTYDLEGSELEYLRLSPFCFTFPQLIEKEVA